MNSQPKQTSEAGSGLAERAGLRVLGIAGSLRARSFNRALLAAAIELAPPDMMIDVFHRLGELPLYNPDVEEAGIPEPVAALKEAIAGADALLIATPEYNFSIPGPLKNAIDWASRPPNASPMRGKPVGIMGVSRGRVGTARGQLALRQSLLFTQNHVMPAPEVLIGNAAEHFDEQLRLTNEATREHVRRHLEAFGAYALRFRA